MKDRVKKKKREFGLQEKYACQKPKHLWTGSVQYHRRADKRK